MRKYFVLFFLLFVPIIVSAKNTDVNIIEVSILDKSEGVTEISSPIFEGNDIQFNLKFSDVLDYVVYSVTVNNSTNDEYAINSLENNDYIKYEIDHNIIKSNGKTTFTLKITYNKQIPYTRYNDTFTNVSKLKLISDKENLVNPLTRNNLYIFIFIIIIICVSCLLQIKNHKKALLLFVLLMIPFSVKGLKELYLDIGVNYVIEPKESVLDIGSVVNSKFVLLANSDRNNITRIIRSNTVPSEVVQAVEEQKASLINIEETDELKEGLYNYYITINNVVLDYDSDGAPLYLIVNNNNETIGRYTESSLLKSLRSTYDFYLFQVYRLRLKETGEYIYKRYVVETDSMVDSTLEEFNQYNRDGVTKAKVISAYRECSNIISIFGDEKEIYAWFDDSDSTIYYYAEDEIIYMNPESSSLFGNLQNLTDLDINTIDSSKVTSLSFVFYNDKSLTSLDLDHWDTSRTTSMSYMFFQNSSLETINQNFNTSRVTTMSYMFYNCNNLLEIDVSKWNTSSLVIANNVFTACKNIVYLDVSNWDVSHVKDMFALFLQCEKLATLDVSKWDTSSVEDLGAAFETCLSLTYLDVSNWNTSNVTSLYATFDGVPAETLDVSNWDVRKVTTMSHMFYSCSNLRELDVSKWKTDSLENMSRTFQGCKNLLEIDVSNWNTSKVTNMSFTFSGCSSLTELDVSKWDTSKVSNISWVFSDCSKLTYLDVSKWNTSQVENFARVFEGCTLLEEVDVSKWDTSNGNTFLRIFNGCNNLKSLDVSKWNTVKVTNMNLAFAGLKKIKILDLSSFNTSSVENTNSMFNGDSSLEIIYVGDLWNMENVMDSTNMFYGCTSLPGFSNSKPRDKTNANTSDTGYLTYKGI